ncbi:MAG: class I SAM-dependent methyltransferase [Gammaproteobacteria bacterium]
MQRISLVKEAHARVQRHLQPGEIALDATVGNGHDTLFLADRVGASGHVYGFDIQAAALASARLKLERQELHTRVTLSCDSHARIAEVIPAHHCGHIKVIMFNLGYLPGSDKTVITRTESTLAALNAAIKILAPNGMITLLTYPGHAGGDEETGAVHSWSLKLNDRQFSVAVIHGVEQKDTSPRLIVIEKIV